MWFFNFAGKVLLLYLNSWLQPLRTLIGHALQCIGWNLKLTCHPSCQMLWLLNNFRQLKCWSDYWIDLNAFWIFFQFWQILTYWFSFDELSSKPQLLILFFIKFILDITYFELAPARWLIQNILLSQVVRGGRGAAENHVLNQCNVIRQLFHINNLILIFDKYFTSMNSTCSVQFC